MPATNSYGCAAFTAIFAPTADHQENPFRIYQNVSEFSIARIACTCKRFIFFFAKIQNITHFPPFRSGFLHFVVVGAIAIITLPSS